MHSHFFEKSVDLFLITGTNGSVVEMNNAVISAFGYSKDELIGNRWYKFVHDADQDASAREFDNIQATCQSFAFVNRIRCKSGKYKFIEWNSFLSTENQIIYVTGRDISNSRRAHDNLNRQLSLLRTIIDSTDFGIISTDANGTIKTFNTRAQRMFGYTDRESINHLTPFIFFDPIETEAYAKELIVGTGENIAKGIDVLLAKARVGLFEERNWTLLRKSRAVFPAHVSVTSLRDENDETYGYLFVARDISEQKRVENLKSEFISTVSHELRTPMTSIRGSLGIMAAGLAGEIPGESKPLIDIAISSTDRLVRLINDMLAMDKIESGKMNFDLKEVEVAPLLEKSLLSNKAFADKHKVSFKLTKSIPQLKILIDPDRLAQILDNLLSNAAKYTKEGDAIEVAMSTDNNAVRVSITDHGPGIPESFKSKVFAKFMQANATDQREKGGTGLGLSICKALVEKQRGSLCFESEDGKGTTFYFEFPIVDNQSNHGKNIV